VTGLLPYFVDIVTDRSGRATFTYRTEEAISVGPVDATVVIPNDQVNGALVTSEFSKAIIVQDAQTSLALRRNPSPQGWVPRPTLPSTGRRSSW